MNKLIAAGVFALTGLAGIAAAAPASAAGGAIPYCSTSTNVDANAALITQQLRGLGHDVSSVEGWNGCIRAYVETRNGEQVAYFDPDTLELITTPGAIIGDAEG